jgi:hypothetical protein
MIDRNLDVELDAAGELPACDRRAVNRRLGGDRRIGAAVAYTGDERRAAPRRKVERRRHIDPTTCERDYTNDEIEFMRAMDEYKRKSGRQFPTWSEVLEVVRSLGYARTGTAAASDGVAPA